MMYGGNYYGQIEYGGAGSGLRVVTFSETVVTTDSVLKSLGRTLSETVTLTDTFASLKVILVVLTETVTMTDLALGRVITRVFTETVVLTDTLIKIAQRIFNETVTLTDTITQQKITILNLSEIVRLTDYLIVRLNGIVTNMWSKVARSLDDWDKQDRN
jgi:hypothetical protein